MTALCTVFHSLFLALLSLTGAFIIAPEKAHSPTTRTWLSSSATTQQQDDESFDVIIIGSGIGGLCCGSLLSSIGKKVCVLESHYELGGCAHEYFVDKKTGRTIPSDKKNSKEHDCFTFEAGPSLYAGISPNASPNPLKHVFQMIDEEPEWITYDRWGAFLPEAPEGYELSIGAENFLKILQQYGGPTARSDWESLAQEVRPLAQTIQSIPSTVVRNDVGIFATLVFRYPIAFVKVLLQASEIVKPFDLSGKVLDPFLKNYLDLLAFLLQGLPASQTLTAVMAYMVEDFYREGAVMDYPKGGSAGIIQALVRGITKHDGCAVRKQTTVEEVVVEDGRAVGVKLKNSDKVIRANQAVVSNADLKQTFDFIPPNVHEGFDQERELYMGSSAKGNDDGSVPLCKSFIHVHLGVNAELIPDDAPAQWTVVQDWSKGIDAPGNVVVVSVPSKLDPTLAPESHHVIHAYGAGNEPYAPWEPFAGMSKSERDSSREYQALKLERSTPVWDAISKRAPLVKPGHCVIEQIGTPLTHAQFLRRNRGNYGLAIPAGSSDFTFPTVDTPLPGYYRCGDSTTAGIGVPAVASSGAQCANALMSVWDQMKLNGKIRM
mmetsp:Transcript_13017/g.19870  ORF Transcript_13017/g.19870 Transcript_13017/m.19870 type:complete len:604 (-) Transcript_13017:39-1850(-)